MKDKLDKTSDNQHTSYETLVLLLLLISFFVFALLNFSWEKVVIRAGGVFGAYGLLIKTISDFMPRTLMFKLTHFFLVACLALFALNIGHSHLSQSDCADFAAKVYSTYQQQNSAFDFPGNIDEQYRGISIAAFDEAQLVSKITQDQVQALHTITQQYCQEIGKNAAETTEIVTCTEERYLPEIKQLVQSFVAEAKRCLFLSYDLNLYLEAPSAESLATLKKKYNITNQTKVKDISQPGLPVIPADGRFVSWFKEPGYYGYHTVKIIRCSAQNNTSDITQIDFIKIN